MTNDLVLKKNLGVPDRVVRLVLGAAFAIVPSLSGWNTWWVALLAVFGGAQLIESATGY